MERIKMAIEKARAEGKSKSALHALRSNSEPISRVRCSHTVESSEISYTRTKIVSLDPAHLESHRIIAINKRGPDTSVFDLLRTRLLQEVSGKGWKTIAVTAPSTGCGKSTVAVNLAISIARQESPTVLLADFDLRRPKISSYLGLDVTVGLSAYIEGNEELSDMLVNPGIPGLVVLPNEKSWDQVSETLVNARVQKLVADLRARYESRLVLINTPALLDGDDALVFLPNVDCVLLVVASGKTTKTELAESLRLLQDRNIAGVVLNDLC